MHYIIVTPKGNPPIKLTHLQTTEQSSGAFNHPVSQVCALWIVRFCQERKKGWGPISKEGFLAYYSAKSNGEHMGSFGDLIDRGWIKIPGNRILLSKEFVGLCYASWAL